MAQERPPLDLNPLVEAVVSSYQSEAKTRHIDASVLPNRDTVMELIELFRQVMFPGFFGKQNLRSQSLNYHVGELLGVIYEKLFEQIRAAIQHEHVRRTGAACPNCDQTAAVVTQEILGSIPRLRAVLATDVQAAFDGDPAAASHDEIIFCYPGFFAISIFRVAHELFEQKVPLIPRIMTEYAHSITGIDIHPGATVGDYFFIDHGTGVVIGETTHIGEHVKIYQGVTLGAVSTRGGQSLKGAKRHPTLEDHVTVYSGASILGGDTIIGTGATINGNVFITTSVPPHTRVSTKNPELQYRNRPPKELIQEPPADWQI